MNLETVLTVDIWNQNILEDCINHMNLETVLTVDIWNQNILEEMLMKNMNILIKDVS